MWTPKLVYRERAFERLPTLADALEDAGCTDQDIVPTAALGALTQPRSRGCWVVDLLLGRS